MQKMLYEIIYIFGFQEVKQRGKLNWAGISLSSLGTFCSARLLTALKLWFLFSYECVIESASSVVGINCGFGVLSRDSVLLKLLTLRHFQTAKISLRKPCSQMQIELKISTFSTSPELCHSNLNNCFMVQGSFAITDCNCKLWALSFGIQFS